MDFIVIGKKDRFTDAPELLYCGTSSADARAAVDANAGTYRRIYRLNPDPIQYYKVAKAYQAAAVTPEPVPTTPEPTQPKRSKKTI